MSFMVFKAPGSNLIHGVMVDFKVIDESEIDEHLSNGWSRFAIEADQALAASQQAAADQKAIQLDDSAAASRAEIEMQLEKLGVKYERRIQVLEQRVKP